MAWVDPAAADSRTVMGSGADALAEYQRALDEWRVLTAAALVGLVEETMTIAAEFAKTRYTLGVPISTLQGISHPLANIAITVAGRPQPGAARGLVPRQRARRAARAGAVGVRVHGRGGVEGGHHGRARPRRSRCFGGGRRDARTWCAPGAGRWPAATPAPAPSTSPRSSRPAKADREAKQWISHGSSCPTRTRPFCDEARDFLREHVTEDVMRRDRETGDNFDEGVHLALGDGRLPGAASGSRNPKAGSTGCGSASGSWRSAVRTCRG